MTGETDSPLAPVQPGGRAAAPGQLALVQSFINSHYDLEVCHGADLFATPTALRAWLRAHGLIKPSAGVGKRDLERALAAREGLRSLAAGDSSSIAVLNHAATGAALEVRFTGDGPRFAPALDGGVGSAVGVVLAITARAMIDGSWSRMKVCPGEDCGWAFYDHSRNQSGRWCSMSVCGGRAKARNHYRRRRGALG